MIFPWHDVSKDISWFNDQIVEGDRFYTYRSLQFSVRFYFMILPYRLLLSIQTYFMIQIRLLMALSVIWLHFWCVVYRMRTISLRKINHVGPLNAIWQNTSKGIEVCAKSDDDTVAWDAFLRRHSVFEGIVGLASRRGIQKHPKQIGSLTSC